MCVCVRERVLHVCMLHLVNDDGRSTDSHRLPRRHGEPGEHLSHGAQGTRAEARGQVQWFLRENTAGRELDVAGERVELLVGDGLGLYIYIHIYVYVYTYTYIHTCIYIYIYI